MPHEATPARYQARPDLELLYGQGAATAADNLIDPFADAIWRYAHDLTPAGGYRPHGDIAPDGEIQQRLSAALAGAASAFAEAAKQRRVET